MSAAIPSGMHSAATVIAEEMRATLAGRAAKRVTDAQAKAERKAEREKKAAARAHDRVLMLDAIKRCALLAKTLPPGYQDWGYVRTRAWSDAARVCATLGRKKTAPLAKLGTAIHNIERVATVDLNQLANEESERRAAKSSARQAGAIGRLQRAELRP